MPYTTRELLILGKHGHLHQWLEFGSCKTYQQLSADPGWHQSTQHTKTRMYKRQNFHQNYQFSGACTPDIGGGIPGQRSRRVGGMTPPQ